MRYRNPALTLKVFVLQKYYGLSDDEAEFQIMICFSFLQVLRFQPSGSVPDAKTIWNFKQLLEENRCDRGAGCSNVLINYFSRKVCW